MVGKVNEFVEEHEDASAKAIRASFRGWLSFFRNAQRSSMNPKAIFDELMAVGQFAILAQRGREREREREREGGGRERECVCVRERGSVRV